MNVLHFNFIRYEHIVIRLVMRTVRSHLSAHNEIISFGLIEWKKKWSVWSPVNYSHFILRDFLQFFCSFLSGNCLLFKLNTVNAIFRPFRHQVCEFSMPFQLIKSMESGKGTVISRKILPTTENQLLPKWTPEKLDG